MRYYVKIEDGEGGHKFVPVEDEGGYKSVSMPCEGFWVIKYENGRHSSGRCVWQKISDFPEHARIGEVFRYVEDIEKILLDKFRTGDSISNIAENICAMIASKVADSERDQIKRDIRDLKQRRESSIKIEDIQDLEL